MKTIFSEKNTKKSSNRMKTIFSEKNTKKNKPNDIGGLASIEQSFNSRTLAENVTVTTSLLSRHSMADSLRKKAEAIKQKAISSVSHVISELSV